MKNASAGLLLLALLATSLAAQENGRDTPTVTDIDGNVYQTVTIGKQVWMAEDLKTTRYRNGDLIGPTTPATLDINSESSPKYQWAYDGDEKNVATYGRLYTWYAVADGRNIAPVGIAVGERFHFVREQTSAAPAATASAGNPRN